MKIGIFDSGLGGLIITHSLTQALPEYDYLYLGDTARVPYGNRPQSEVYEFTRQGVEYLFNQGCSLVILACNTASAEALRRLQLDYLPSLGPAKKLLGVLIPAAETAVSASPAGHIGVIATTSTIESGAFDRELRKLQPNLQITSVAAPQLVPLIEAGNLAEAALALDDYLAKLPPIDTLILGCTHYPYIKNQVRQRLGNSVTVISQDEILPAKLRSYLEAHPQLGAQLTRHGARQFDVTLLTNQAVRLAARLYGDEINLRLVTLPD